MKKVILGMMLVMGSLSFSNDRNLGENTQKFEKLNLRSQIFGKQKENNNILALIFLSMNPSPKSSIYHLINGSYKIIFS